MKKSFDLKNNKNFEPIKYEKSNFFKVIFYSFKNHPYETLVFCAFLLLNVVIIRPSLPSTKNQASGVPIASTVEKNSYRLPPKRDLANIIWSDESLFASSGKALIKVSSQAQARSQAESQAQPQADPGLVSRPTSSSYAGGSLVKKAKKPKTLKLMLQSARDPKTFEAYTKALSQKQAAEMRVVVGLDMAKNFKDHGEWFRSKQAFYEQKRAEAGQLVNSLTEKNKLLADPTLSKEQKQQITNEANKIATDLARNITKQADYQNQLIDADYRMDTLSDRIDKISKVENLSEQISRGEILDFNSLFSPVRVEVGKVELATTFVKDSKKFTNRQIELNLKWVGDSPAAENPVLPEELRRPLDQIVPNRTRPGGISIEREFVLVLIRQPDGTYKEDGNSKLCVVERGAEFKEPQKDFIRKDFLRKQDVLSEASLIKWNNLSPEEQEGFRYFMNVVYTNTKYETTPKNKMTCTKLLSNNPEFLVKMSNYELLRPCQLIKDFEIFSSMNNTTRQQAGLPEVPQEILDLPLEVHHRYPKSLGGINHTLNGRAYYLSEHYGIHLAHSVKNVIHGYAPTPADLRSADGIFGRVYKAISEHASDPPTGAIDPPTG